MPQLNSHQELEGVELNNLMQALQIASNRQITNLSLFCEIPGHVAVADMARLHTEKWMPARQPPEEHPSHKRTTRTFSTTHAVSVDTLTAVTKLGAVEAIIVLAIAHHLFLISFLLL